MRDQKRPAFAGLVLLVFLVLFGAVFTALGVWQLHRRTWKLDLMEAVDRRVHAPAVLTPGPKQWPQVSYDHDLYRHVVVHGRYMNDDETYVHATSELGMGFWVLTPFRSDRGFTVLVNRGFVPYDRRLPSRRKEGMITGETSVTGLLRLSEPKGAFLRDNKPDEDVWYSRDVRAIAQKRKLNVIRTAPYFIDADGGLVQGGWPRGGLTVISFPNNHLVYALTWFALALLCVVGAGTVLAKRGVD